MPYSKIIKEIWEEDKIQEEERQQAGESGA
jgi:hypothetical protein